MSRYDSPGYEADVPGLGAFDPRLGAADGTQGVDVPTPRTDPVGTRDPFAGYQPADMDDTTASQDLDYVGPYGDTGAGRGRAGHAPHPNAGTPGTAGQGWR